MDKAIIYIHGKGGSSKEAKHYITIFKDCDVIGFDYMSNNPWEAVFMLYKQNRKLYNDTTASIEHTFD